MGNVISLFRHAVSAQNEERPLQLEEVPELPLAETVAEASAKFEKLWESEITSRPVEKISLVRVMITGYLPEHLINFFLRLVYEATSVGITFVLQAFIRWLDEEDPAPWKGYVLALGLFLLNALLLASLALGSFYTVRTFQKIRSALHQKILEKVFRLRKSHEQQGKIVALHSTDVSKLKELLFLHNLTTAPFMVIGNVVAMYMFIGWPGLLAFAVIFILTAMQSFATNRMGRIMGTLFIYTDRRIQLLREVIEGIRICKFMTWESKFLARVRQLREDEVSKLRETYWYRSFVIGSSHSVPMLLQLTVFGTAYAVFGEVNSASVFPVIALMNSLRSSVAGAALTVGKVIEAVVSMRRVQDLLLTEELPAIKGSGGSADTVGEITLRGSTGYIKSGEFVPLISDVSLRFPKGSFTIIMGPTGCGKTTLLEALLGEAPLKEGSELSNCSAMGYVSQQAWIMSGTIRQNIVLDRPFDNVKYDKITTVCELLADFSLLPFGDLTSIGEKGVNLSGGQRQRLALARAAYSGSDVILLDDPLSAVDSRVSKALFNNCIMSEMNGKTRILVTHQTHYLDRADQIVVMKEGSVVFKGNYEQFQESEHDLKGVLASTEANEAPPHATAEMKGTGEEEEDDGFSPASPEAKAVDSIMTEERLNYGGIGRHVYLWYVKLGGCGNMIVLLTLFTIWRVAQVFADVWLALWTHQSGGFGKSYYSNNEYMMWFGICAGIAVVFIAIRQMMFNHFVVEASKEAQDQMLSRVLYGTTAFFDTTPVGRILNRFSKDVQAVDFIIPDMGIFFLTLFFLALGLLALMFIASFYLIPLVVLILIFYEKLRFYYSATVRGTKRLENVERSPVMAIMSETLDGLVTIRRYGYHHEVSRRHAEATDRMQRCVYCQMLAFLSQLLFVSVIGSFVVFCCAALAVVFKVESSPAIISPGTSITALAVTYSLALTISMSYFVGVSGELDSSMSSVERIKEYAEEIDVEETETQRALHPADAATTTGTPVMKDVWPVTGKLVFREVTMRYRPGLPLVLKGISFQLEHGMKVGVVGRTGSGKSSLIAALFRFVELASGAIELDDVNIAARPLCDLRKHITVIPQEPLLFSGTIRSNLDPFDDFTDSELWDVLGKSGLKQRLGENAGLDVEVKEKGSNFSFGEKQLICLARAILKKSRLLILDEATANVDMQTDEFIQKAVRTEFADCTVLTIAHRLSTVIDLDRIIVMEAGLVADFGSPRELINNPESLFHNMVSALGPNQFASLKAVAERPPFGEL